MMVAISRAAIILLGGLSLAACEAGQSRQAVGTGIGGVAGAALGSGLAPHLPSWMRPLAPAAAAGIGALAGNQIGAYLDERDRDRMNAAAQQALVTGRTQTWSNPQTGVSGEARVVDAAAERPGSPSRPAPARTAAAARQGECRTVRRTVSLADGTQLHEDVRSCLGPNGWQEQQRT